MNTDLVLRPNDTIDSCGTILGQQQIIVISDSESSPVRTLPSVTHPGSDDASQGMQDLIGKLGLLLWNTASTEVGACSSS